VGGITITLDEEIKKIEQQRKEKKIGLRIVDTNVPMQNADFIYILTGNLHKVESYEQAIKTNKYAKELLERFRKKPHDLLIPNCLRYELDKIKGSKLKTPEEQYSARKALGAINEFLRFSNEYLEEYENKNEFEKIFLEIRDGKRGITLDNGANVYFAGISNAELLELNDDDSIEISNDKKIIFTARKFIENNPHYENVKAITDDKEFSTTSILNGIRTEPFRFEKIKNPLQSNRGIYEIDISCAKGKLIEPLGEIDPEDKKLKLKLNPDLLTNNQIIQFNIKNRKKPDEKPKIEYRIFNPHTRKLNSLDNFLDFYEFFKSRMYKDANESTGKDEIIYVNKNQLSDLNYANSIFNKLKELGKMSDKLYEEHLEITNTLKNKKGPNRRKKILPYFDHFEKEKHITFESKNAKLNERKYKGVLELPYNQILIPRGEQIPFLDHLLNENIDGVSIDAKGGFGKTLWALAVGTYLVHQGKYEKILYIPAMATSEDEIGFVKGDKMQKIEDKIAPAKDALRELFTNDKMGGVTHAENVKNYVESLENKGIIEYDVATNIKGRTYHNTFAIFDESHLRSRDELGLVIGRVGRGSKLVVMSAIEQGLSSKKYKGHLDPRTTGIAHMAEKLTIFKSYAHLSASPTQIYRSIFAKMAAVVVDRSLDIIQ
jgi:predicted ribonuclease YlaK